MIELHESTLVAAPVQRTFDLARSIDVHLLGNTHFGEQATAGTRTGLIGMGESVTWRARHFWINQSLTSAITAFEPPGYFQDTMLRGAFRSMQHDHYFTAAAPSAAGEAQTEMRDVFRFSAPLGPLGWLAERLVLRRYMRTLLTERNRIIAQVAADGSWRKYVPA